MVRAPALLSFLAGCTLVVGGLDPRDKTGLDGSIDPCADIQTDPKNCGACGRDCTSLPGVNATKVHCTAGQCDLRDSCLPGRADCGGGYIDGCETDLSTADHCGNCISQCGGQANLCTRTSGGLYTCTAVCPFGTTQCGTSCADVFNDPLHCGSCNHPCSAGNNQVPVCQGGVCQAECSPGFHVCNGVCVDSSSLSTCGTSCTPCTAPAHSKAVCDPFGGCDFVCDIGYTKSFGSCVQNMSTPDMTMGGAGDMTQLPLCDCSGLAMGCIITNQCVGNNCCLEDQIMTPPPAGTCVDKTPCQPSTG